MWFQRALTAARLWPCVRSLHWERNRGPRGGRKHEGGNVCMVWTLHGSLWKEEETLKR